MKRIKASLILLFALCVIGFGTWQLYLGNLEAAFSVVPFLLVTYLFVKRFSQE